MLIDLRNKGVTGKATEQALVRAHITANKNMVPFDDKSPFTTSGIRLGAPAITTRGLKEGDMDIIADLIDRVVMNIDSDSHIKEVGDTVVKMMQDRPLFTWE
jgi:glycine hydroxymethyltransferase